MYVRTQVSARELTTFRVGGSVANVITIESREEVSDVVRFAESLQAPIIPVGGGSNILVPDGLLAVTFLRYAPRDITVDGPIVRVSAGARWDDLVLISTQHGLRGLENLSGIPGTVGGAVAQNIGAYGAVLADTLLSVTAFDLHEKEWRVISSKACSFGYRSSMFSAERDRYLVTQAEFALSRDMPLRIDYRDLADAFRDCEPTQVGVRDTVLRIRADKFPSLTEFGTAGSYFMNPVLDARSAYAVAERYPGMPTFHLPEGGVKVPLAWLIDHVLGMRGQIHRGVEVWRGQSLVLAAHENATSSDVRRLASHIARRVFEETNIHITPEVREL
ncbi:UDP-N-acetylmuramate dehydrogenase [Patescibacteria group bacterium]|nr:UDP-N-acetylmuramate dehydrogenase [Patescibacteria group bacterium]